MQCMLRALLKLVENLKPYSGLALRGTEAKEEQDRKHQEVQKAQLQTRFRVYLKMT